jgi:hypothetical protein
VGSGGTAAGACLTPLVLTVLSFHTQSPKKGGAQGHGKQSCRGSDGETSDSGGLDRSCSAVPEGCPRGAARGVSTVHPSSAAPHLSLTRPATGWQPSSVSAVRRIRSCSASAPRMDWWASTVYICRTFARLLIPSPSCVRVDRASTARPCQSGRCRTLRRGSRSRDASCSPPCAVATIAAFSA